MTADFTHLHVHTQYSLLDGAIRLDDLMSLAVSDKMEAVAITDHGNMFGVLDFYNKAKEHGLKPVLGSELYLAPQSRFMKGPQFGQDDEIAPHATSRTGLYHINLLCMNEEGYQNLCRLVSIGYLEGFYYRPRIDKEVLSKYSAGLIATSACMKGELAHLCLIGDLDRARESLKWYKHVFKDRFYLEMQSSGLPQQMIINQRFQELAASEGVPLVATADCHYLHKEDAYHQEVLLHIQTGRHIEVDRHSLKTDEFYFKSQQTMKDEFSFCKDAISNTMEIAKQCNFEFKFTDEHGKKIYHYPKFDPPHGLNAIEYLNQLATEGLTKRLKETSEITKKSFTQEEISRYQIRLDKELSVINEMGFTGYFLIVSDFIGYAKNNGIPVGPGRGSGAGSLVAYVLRITELDPLEHGLLFERFLNPERISLPDFDIDFCMDKRDRVIQYVSDKYGKDCVAQIITFGKLQARGVIRDVGRVFGLPVPEVDRVAKLVPETLNITLKEALEQEPRLKEITERDPVMSNLIDTCRSLEGLYRHASIHAAGLVISNRPMVEHCPLYRGKNNELVIQFDMNNADKIGLIKFDFLGLKTLTFLDRVCNLINDRYPDRNFQLERISIEDKKTFELLCKGDTFGVFQMESSGMQDLMRRVRPTAFGDIVAINALYRPGPIGSGMLDDFIGRKHGEVPIVYDFEDLKPILGETYGVIVYQEQVQQIAMKLAGYTAGGADLLRRAMGKKKPEEMAKQKTIFLEGTTKNKYDKVKSEKIFDLMEKFAGYGFNKSHAAAYSLITMQTAYIKAHYPVEFYSILLTIEGENTDKITKYIADAKKHSISVLQPDINESDTDFTVLTENQIRFGLGAIKGVGQIAIESVLDARKQDGAFKDLYDLAVRTNSRTVNKRVMEAFVKAGALDGFKINRASLFAAIDDALSMGASVQKTRDDNQNSFLDLLGDHGGSFSVRTISYPDEKPWPRLLELKYEKETIGFFVTGHPLDDFKTEVSQYTSGSLAELSRLGSSKKDFILGALVVTIREVVTKRGDRMAFITLEDQYDQIEAVAFPDLFLENEALFKGGDPVWIKGKVEASEAGYKFILSKKDGAKVLPLKYAYEAFAREMHLHIPEDLCLTLDKDRFLILQNYLNSIQDKAGKPFYLHLNLGNKTIAVLKLKESIALKRDTVSYIQGILKYDKAYMEFR